MKESGALRAHLTRHAYAWLAGGSLAAGVAPWSMVAGVIELPRNSALNSYWTLGGLFAIGFVAAVATVRFNRLPTLFLLMGHGVSLWLWWQFRWGS